MVRKGTKVPTTVKMPKASAMKFKASKSISKVPKISMPKMPKMQSNKAYSFKKKQV